MRLVYGCGLYVDFYGIALDQHLVQNVQGLSSICEQKIAGPKNVFNNSYRPKMELNRDIVISLGGTCPLEIFDLKITIFCYAILHS